MNSVRRGALGIVALLTLVASGCAQDPVRSDAAAGAAPAPAVHAAPVARQAAATRGPRVSKLLVVVEENHSLAQMRSGMPYAFSLAKRYGYATDYAAMRHPSLPNYLAVAGGSTFGVDDDAGPSVHRLAARSVFGQALAHSRSAAIYAQSMPRRCATANSGAYAVRHNPWTYFTRERAACRRHDLPMSAFAGAVRRGELPQVGMVVPDVRHDAHDGTLATADAWFRAVMRRVFAGRDWRSGHLAVVLTADEDDRSQGNRVLTVVIHPSQRHHVVRRHLTHYSLTRLYGDVANLPYLRKARTAPSMATAFGLPVG